MASVVVFGTILSFVDVCERNLIAYVYMQAHADIHTSATDHSVLLWKVAMLKACVNIPYGCLFF